MNDLLHPNDQLSTLSRDRGTTYANYLAIDYNAIFHLDYQPTLPDIERRK